MVELAGRERPRGGTSACAARSPQRICRRRNNRIRARALAHPEATTRSKAASRALISCSARTASSGISNRSDESCALSGNGIDAPYDCHSARHRRRSASSPERSGNAPRVLAKELHGDSRQRLRDCGRSLAVVGWRANVAVEPFQGSAAANGSAPVSIWYNVTPQRNRDPLRASVERLMRPVCSGSI